jgi:uncharacterized membrane protein YccC
LNRPVVYFVGVAHAAQGWKPLLVITLRDRARRLPVWSASRAIRAAIAAPIAFAIASAVLPPATALFAAFGTIIQLLFVEFTGPGRHARVVWFTATTSALVVLGTVLSTHIVLAAVGIALIGFCISFGGVASPAVATGTPAALFAVTLAGTVPAGLPDILPRLAAWAIASVSVIVATTVILPAPNTDPVQQTTVKALDGLRRSSTGTGMPPRAPALRAAFVSLPHQPGALSRDQRRFVAVAGRVLQLTQALDRIVSPTTMTAAEQDLVNRTILDAELVLAGDLEARDALLDDQVLLENAREDREDHYEGEPSHADLQVHVALQAASAMAGAVSDTSHAGRDTAEEALNVLRSQLHPRSSWFRSSARTAVALGLSIAVAHALGVEHAFWVSFGTLTVLRTNALNTGQFAGRALIGTVVGAAVGELIILLSPGPALEWALLPLALLVTGLAPGIIPFAVGQGAFSVAILLLFGITAPDAALGVARVEDLVIGAGVSVLVALVAWPRGAASRFRTDLADAYESASNYLEAAVASAVDRGEDGHCARLRRRSVESEQRAEQSLRGVMLERGSGFASTAQVARLLELATATRETADWVIDFSTHRRAERGTHVAAWAATAIQAQAHELLKWQESTARAVRAGHTAPTVMTAGSRNEIRGHDALPAWISAQLFALAETGHASTDALNSLPRH